MSKIDPTDGEQPPNVPDAESRSIADPDDGRPVLKLMAPNPDLSRRNSSK